jgi:hypothetical protein
MNTQRFLAITAMIVVAAASTLIPHPPNFTPLAAIALFAGAQLTDRRAAFAATLGTLLLRDAILGFHSLMPFVYACYALNVCLGICLRANQRPWRVAGATVVGATIFFLVTNFAVWAILGTFPPTFAGLIACYVAGIPYFGNTLSSDLLYSIAMFGGFALVQSRIPSLRLAAVAKSS